MSTAEAKLTSELSVNSGDFKGKQREWEEWLEEFFLGWMVTLER